MIGKNLSAVKASKHDAKYPMHKLADFLIYKIYIILHNVKLLVGVGPAFWHLRAVDQNHAQCETTKATGSAVSKMLTALEVVQSSQMIQPTVLQLN